MANNINADGIHRTIYKLDQSLYSYFQDLGITITANGTQEKVPITWGTGEKWSIIKNKKMLRDANGSLILPIISITSMGVADDPQNNVLAALPKSERLIISKEAISNESGNGLEYLVTSIRYPKQISCTYEMNIWAQYLIQMNEIIQYLITKQHYQQSFCFYDKDNSGYRYNAFMDAPLNSKDNVMEIGQEERIIIKSITFRITFPIIDKDSDLKQERGAMKIRFGESV